MVTQITKNQESTQPRNIAKALNAVMNEVGAVAKDGALIVNGVKKYNFRGVDAVVNAVSPLFAKHGIIVVPDVLESSYVDVQVGEKRTNQLSVRLRVMYHFISIEDDSAINAVVVAEAMDSGDKATSKAMSVAYRTALLQTLCLPTDENDPDLHQAERSEGQSATQAPYKIFSRQELVERLHKMHDPVEVRNFGAWLNENKKTYDEAVLDVIREEYMDTVKRVGEEQDALTTTPSVVKPPSTNEVTWGNPPLDSDRGSALQAEFDADNQQ